MKLLRIIGACFLLLSLLATLGCAGTPTRESTGEYIDDSAITARIKEAIFREPALKSSEINVETFKGVVQLSGFVGSPSDMDKAVEIARGVKGVQSVNNDMRSK